jgi:hypothetical protein
MAKLHMLHTKKKRAKPFLASAFFCERLVEEKDGVISVMRIVDTLTITQFLLATPTPVPVIPVDQQSMPPIGSQILIFVSFKSGDAKGKYFCQLFVVTPDGKRDPITEKSPMIFLGKEHGVNMRVNVPVPTQEGLYWFEVMVDGSLVTKMPLRIRHTKTTEKGAASPVAKKGQ